MNISLVISSNDEMMIQVGSDYAHREMVKREAEVVHLCGREKIFKIVIS